MIKLTKRKNMKILVIGSGAREHAVVWKLLQGPGIEEIFVAPGNAGTAGMASNLSISVTEIPALIKAARQNKVAFTFVGPETPLAAGIVDQFQSAGLAIFGPSRAAARIEASKVFSKDLMHKYSVPTASSRAFISFESASKYVNTLVPPIVIKADGLAAGKGVVIAHSVEDALFALKSMMQDKEFGASGEQVVIEEFLTGREMSVFAFTDGISISSPVTACDYKRIFDANEGPNTGGMGSFSPPEFYDEELGERAMREIMRPTIKALDAEASSYSGVLYGGLMLTLGGLKTIEFNCRLGDPETQVILPRLESDLAEIAIAVIEHRLEKMDIQWSSKPCVGVVMASGGYPGHYDTGLPISGLDDLEDDVMTFHAGTKLDASGRVVTSGGRVLTVVAKGETLAQARQKVYNNISRISFKGAHYRKDIASF